MQKLRAEPFLWIHVAGIVVFPLWMTLTVMGFATGDPLLPVWLEQVIVLSIGIGLVTRMQVQRPFYLFSVLVVSLPPEQLSPQRRRILAAFQSPSYRWVVPVLVSVLMVLLGQWLYTIAPLFHSLSILPESRWIGLGVSLVGFWAANLFIQIPAAAAWVLSADESQLDDQFEPVDLEILENQFTLVGQPKPNLLSRWDPALLVDSPPEAPEAISDTPEQLETETEESGSDPSEPTSTAEVTTPAETESSPEELDREPTGGESSEEPVATDTTGGETEGEQSTQSTESSPSPDQVDAAWAEPTAGVNFGTLATRIRQLSERLMAPFSPSETASTESTEEEDQPAESSPDPIVDASPSPEQVDATPTPKFNVGILAVRIKQQTERLIAQFSSTKPVASSDPSATQEISGELTSIESSEAAETEEISDEPALEAVETETGAEDAAVISEESTLDHADAQATEAVPEESDMPIPQADAQAEDLPSAQSSENPAESSEAAPPNPGEREAQPIEDPGEPTEEQPS